MSQQLAAVLLAVGSAYLYAVGAILQEQVAATTPAVRWAVARRPRWWVAVGLNGSGAGLHVLALALGSLTVVQPLGALTLVFVLPMAALLVRRPVSPAGWRGSLLVSVGLAGLLALTDAGVGRAPRPGEQLLVGALMLATVGPLLLLALWGRARVWLRSVCLAATAGVAYGAASVWVKVVVEGDPLPLAWTVLVPAALVGLLAVLGLAASQTAYRGAGLAAPLATATVVNPLFAATVGAWLLGEGFRLGRWGVLLALLCGAVTSWGLVYLTRDVSRRRPVVRPSASRRTPRRTAQL
ncbi:DMT family transporter [Streptomyces sp. NPDC005438]|uniref:DMT family transporter n=1 Tax=Streptomyces sp. NPDC005438 TaxID=3156880 RepID=UPI0033B33816